MKTTGKHFIGNALCSSDNFLTELFKILHLFTINNGLHKTPEGKARGVKSEERCVQRMGPPSPFISNDQETPCPERQEHDGKVR
jgi:hypothetical protein